ncbi:MAG: tRNA (guanosine(37)-N1)-methyltransferase TrmD [Clostridiales bacterium]|jgi:tRNA (guanine37-N1)-methyltransferase|nr:tRNA (guanosine(37)-N1)-methyltransferase TrmD [Clostridiales bacterium]
MDFHVLTLFPEMVSQGLNTSIIGRAIDKGLISLNTVNIRDFSNDKHKRVDDYPYGGGAGMVIQAEPVYKAYRYLADQIISEQEARRTSSDQLQGAPNQVGQAERKRPRVIYVTPQGPIFNQKMAQDLAKEDSLIFLCGHYEGIDERVLELIVTDYISIGDYVLTGGELPAMVMIDAISRLIPGVLNNDISSEFESLHDNLLEYPQYTRPEIFRDLRVPEVLLSGHHANIEAWRRQEAIKRTLERRPDLLPGANLNKKEQEYLRQLIQKQEEKNKNDS